MLYYWLTVADSHTPYCISSHLTFEHASTHTYIYIYPQTLAHVSSPPKRKYNVIEKLINNEQCLCCYAHTTLHEQVF